MFDLRGKISRKLISIHMPPHGVALNCQACLSVPAYRYRLMCAGEEKPPMFSINGITGRSAELAVSPSFRLLSCIHFWKL